MTTTHRHRRPVRIVEERPALRVVATSDVVLALIDWADDDPEHKMGGQRQEDFMDGYRRCLADHGIAEGYRTPEDAVRARCYPEVGEGVPV